MTRKATRASTQFMLGRELYSLERALAAHFVTYGHTLSDNEKMEGIPYFVNAYGQQQELPYTGLEGYYAGSIRTSEYPGMASEEVVQEEAHIGIEILRTIKKEAPPPQG